MGHLKHLEIVPEVLRYQKLFGKLPKRVFAASEVEYLKHVPRRDDVIVDPHNIDAIKC